MSKNISVIIPVIEDNTYLLRCINMLQRQTVLPLEIIVADQNVEIKEIYSDNVFCLSEDEGLIPLKKNPELEYGQKDFFENIFDEERRIAANINKALELANGDYIYFCNISSVLSANVLEILSNNNVEDEISIINTLFYTGKEYLKKEDNDLLWGKLFPKKLFAENKLAKWNYLDIFRWIDNVQKLATLRICTDNAYLYEESYEEIIQKVFTVKIKDDVNKYKKIFLKRVRNGEDLFENINTYDYVKVNVITSIMEQCIEDPNIVLELAEKYVLPIFNNRLNAKENRKVILHKSLCAFFESIEVDEKQYDIILFFFGMNRKMCEAFKIYNFEAFEKIYQHWKKLNFKEI